MHEVTATTLPWTGFLLSSHPGFEAGIQEELIRVLGGRPATVEDIPNLTYTNMVLAETRRLYPSVWIVGRFLRQDVKFGEYDVPARSIILASQDVTHRDPRFFPEPERFDPYRWTDEARALRPAFSYFPFSDGPRRCAGEEFAKTEDTLILATLAQHWQVRSLPDQVLVPRPQKSNAPRGGIQVLVEPIPNL